MPDDLLPWNTSDIVLAFALLAALALVWAAHMMLRKK